MKKLALLALALSLGTANAADMPVKAVQAYPVASNGWYIGVHTSANVAQANVSGNNLFATSFVNGKLMANGGEIGGTFGYIYGSVVNDRWIGFSNNVSYQNISALAPVAGANAGVVSRWSAMQTVEISATWLNTLIGALPNLGLSGITSSFPGFTPIAPPGILVGSPHQYFGFGLREFGISGSFGDSTGTSWSVAPQIQMGSIWQVLSPSGKPTGSAAKAYAWIAFPTKGVTFNGLFGNGNPAINSGASLGTQYGIALDYAFGL